MKFTNTMLFPTVFHLIIVVTLLLLLFINTMSHVLIEEISNVIFL